jgi:ribonucleoside-diphosphate reductase alpha chain
MKRKNSIPYEEWESSRYDWEKVRQRIKRNGLRNVFFLALMPTASSAHISGSNEAFEPWTQNCYLRSLLSGEFLVVNDLMVNDLIDLGIWDERTQKHFKQNDGSISGLKIDTNVYSWWNKEKAKKFARLQEVYMTAFEIPMKHQIEMAANRQKFVDQAQSFNFFCDNTPEKLDYNYITAFHFAGWKSGLKTGMYYFRGKPVTENMNQSNRLDELSKNKNSEELATKICVLDRDSGCVSCQ